MTDARQHSTTTRMGARTPRQWDVVALSAIAGVVVAIASPGCTSDRAEARRAPEPRPDAAVVDERLHEGRSDEDPIIATPLVISETEWAFAGRPGFIIRTPHYRLFTTETDDVLRRRMPLFLEHAIAHYRTAITELPTPPQKLDTYLMDSRPQWETLTTRLLGVEADPFQQIQRGGYASNGLGVYFDIGLYDTLAIAAHEGWHQYTQRTFREPLPIWLEEGLATYMEGHAWRAGAPVFRAWQNLERFDALSDVVARDDMIPLERLMSERPADLLDGEMSALLRYYAQVWALTHFLVHAEDGRYAGGLALLLQDAASGEVRERLAPIVGVREASRAIGTRLGDAVARVYFESDAATLDRQYRDFVNRLTAQGARDAIASGRAPF